MVLVMVRVQVMKSRRGGGTHEEGVHIACGGGGITKRGYTLRAEGVVSQRGGIHYVRRGWYHKEGVHIACGGGGTHEEGVYIARGGGGTHEEGVYIACGGGGITKPLGGIHYVRRGWYHKEGVHIACGGGIHLYMRAEGVQVQEGVHIACRGGVHTWYNYYCP